MITLQQTKRMTICLLLPLHVCLPQIVYANQSATTVYVDNMHTLDSYLKKRGKGLAITTSMIALDIASLKLTYQYASKKKAIKLLDEGDSACIVNKLKPKNAQKNIYLATQSVCITVINCII